jgi:hypothetical protein
MGVYLLLGSPRNAEARRTQCEFCVLDCPVEPVFQCGIWAPECHSSSAACFAVNPLLCEGMATKLVCAGDEC